MWKKLSGGSRKNEMVKKRKLISKYEGLYFLLNMDKNIHSAPGSERKKEEDKKKEEEGHKKAAEEAKKENFG